MFYTIIFESQISQKNTKKIRKVFNSGVNFYISSNVLKKPLSIASVRDIFNGLRNIPVKHIDSGRVILTSKINGQWGGIVIDKDYPKGGRENIIK